MQSEQLAKKKYPRSYRENRENAENKQGNYTKCIRHLGGKEGLRREGAAGSHPPAAAVGCFEEYIFFKMEIYFRLWGRYI